MMCVKERERMCVGDGERVYEIESLKKFRCVAPCQCGSGGDSFYRCWSNLLVKMCLLVFDALMILFSLKMCSDASTLCSESHTSTSLVEVGQPK